MNEWLFSYGTLREERVQLNLFGQKLDSAADKLKKYKLVMIEITDESFLSLGEGKNQSNLIFTDNINDVVTGMALSVSPEELLIADKYEPSNYKRVIVELESGRKAWIYLAT